MKKGYKFTVVYTLIIVLLSVALYKEPFPVSAAAILYVAPGGNNENACTNPTLPCATIQAAIQKASIGDSIRVAAGTYTDTGDQVVQINKNLHLSGGWNSAFTVQNGETILDGQGIRRGMYVENNITVTLELFSLENGIAGIVNNGDLTASYIVVRNNTGASYCEGVGITNYGIMSIQWSTISGNKCTYGGYGGGIYNWQYGGSLTILNSTISNNQAATGGGIYNHNTLTVINSTISNNKATFGFSNSGGGGIYNDASSATLKNTTITGNEGAFRGGGIYSDAFYGGNINLANTIVANNTANYSFDCYGPISSAGYNIIGDTMECSFNNTAGDQLNVNPKLGLLQNNGGNTPTHWLYEGSPAIDGGNPAGCTDHLGNPLTTDQRGNTRPLDGNSDANIVCDIGAYEADPNNLPPPPPESLWYVTPVGDDQNNCRTPATACITIQNVMDKAVSNDTIYASTGVYTMTSGNEVVLIDKNINLLGGWNNTFTDQSGRSTIDGQHHQRGVTIDGQITVKIENFIIQNGLATYADIIGYGGGGIYIGYRSKVTLSNSIVQANTAGSGNHSSPNGGGIAMSGYGSLTLDDSAVVGNVAYGKGGGISSGESTLILNNSMVGYNSADTGGGISGGGQIKVNQSRIINNTNTNPTTGGGGLHCSNLTLTMKDSFVSGNVAAGEGGGIYGVTLIIDHSSIFGNKAASGGGISSWYTVDIRNSSISYNTATYGDGGGIYSREDLVLVNTTITYNKARNPSTYRANGGGIFRGGGVIQASNVTIAKNEAEDEGGGIWNQTAPVTLRNSLLADNKSAIGPDCTGTISTAGYNLIGSLSGCSFSPGTGDLTNIDPRLALSYGRPSVLAVLPNSPAIDGGTPSGCVDDKSNGITTDQIGTVRSIDGNKDGNSICDIGAYEYDPAHPPQWLFLPLVTR